MVGDYSDGHGPKEGTPVADETTTATIEAETEASEENELVEETLIEEISIDGMCGVY
jgi:mycofactocin precursor